MAEQIIQLVTILFLLSMVCERIADFLKHYLNKSNKLRIGDTITKFPLESNHEDERYYRILKINIWCGMLTAVILKADLIKILNNVEEAGKTLGWDQLGLYQGIDYVLLPFGLILTGCFISFGSKFWHDLLDILLEIKNAKRSITQLNAGQSPGQTQDFEKLKPTEKDELLKTAIHTLSGYWATSITNYQRVSAGKKITNNQATENNCLRFYVSSKEYKGKIASPVPEFVFYGGYKIPTDVVKDSGEMKLHDWQNPGNGITPASPGTSISRKGNTATGTISLKVRKKIKGENRFYALSCYHVLFDNEFSSGIAEVNNSQEASEPKIVKIPGDDVTTGGNNIGVVGWGKIDVFVDAGVALLNNPSDLSEVIEHIGTPDDIYTVITDDENKLSVSFSGAKSGLISNILVKGCHASKPVDTPVGEIIFQDLIQIEKCSDFGDSGAPVVDQFNRLIGIIEGSDESFTYVIPIQNIINRIKVNPIVKN